MMRIVSISNKYAQLRPIPYGFLRNKHDGTCCKIVDGKRCGKPFTGPLNRKFCNEHSATVKYVGR
jgi:hypothetical protein